MTATLHLYEATDALNIVREWFDDEENIVKLIAADGDIAAVPELAALLEEAEGTFREKAERVALYIRELVASAKAIEEEEKRLSQRRKAKERAAESLKQYLLRNMQQSGIRKVEGQLATVAVQKSPPAVRCTLDEGQLASYATDAWWVTEIPASYKVNSRAVLEQWKAGEPLPDGITVEQGEHVRIR